MKVKEPTMFFTPVKTLPEGTVFLTDLNRVTDFQNWLDEFETLLGKNRRFATVCLPIRVHISHKQHVADRKLYLAWIKKHQPRLRQYCAAMVRIETDPAEFSEIQAQSAQLSKAINIAYIAEQTEEAAMQRAEEALRRFVR